MGGSPKDGAFGGMTQTVYAGPLLLGPEGGAPCGGWSRSETGWIRRLEEGGTFPRGGPQCSCVLGLEIRICKIYQGPQSLSGVWVPGPPYPAQ